MILVLLIGLLLIAVSFGLFARTLLLPRMRAADSLRQINVYGFSGTAAESSDSNHRGLPRLHLREGVDSLATKFGKFISSRVTSVNEENLRRILQSAGFYTMQPGRFVGYQALATLASASWRLSVRISVDRVRRVCPIETPSCSPWTSERTNARTDAVFCRFNMLLSASLRLSPMLCS